MTIEDVPKPAWRVLGWTIAMSLMALMSEGWLFHATLWAGGVAYQLSAMASEWRLGESND